MKKKMNRMFVVISLVAIILTTGLITVVYYNLFRGQVLADLKDYLVVMQEAAEAGDGLEALGARLVEREIRVTLIEPSGEVIFDNEVNKDALENHLSRPEIKEALDSGEGESVRKSETLSRNTFYYAVKLQDGRILRVAKEAGSIVSIFSSVFLNY